MHNLSIDLETFSSEPIAKTGLYKYVQSRDFQVLLFAYSLDNAPVQVLDLTREELPEWLKAALYDPAYIKHAFNAAFEWYALGSGAVQCCTACTAGIRQVWMPPARHSVCRTACRS